MIRVAFIYSDSAGWLGGRNYLLNLLVAIMSLPDRVIEPVLFLAADQSPDGIDDFRGIEVVRSRAVQKQLPVRLPRLISMSLLGRDIALEAVLRSHRIDVLSHSRTLGARASIPAITWIADFQHVRMPEFFAKAEIKALDRAFQRNLAAARMIVLSSVDAQKDLALFSPGAEQKSGVVNFVSGLLQPAEDSGRLVSSYNLHEPFFLIPNQFWKHKNHRVVVDALALLDQQNIAPLVVCTGKGEDDRNPEYFVDLMQHVADTQLNDRFRWLGIVPYRDLALLMRYSVAIINPSYFEGWSTSVEEAKSLGKKILLSDIPVHREQAPARATYFPPDDAVALADALALAIRDFDPDVEATIRNDAILELPERLRFFAQTYQKTVLKVVSA